MENVKTLDELFHGHLFKVPDYQRGYAWEEGQVGDFLEDLDLLSPSKWHYTGTIVLHAVDSPTPEQDRDGQHYSSADIVDGQQRLTTTILVLDGIRKALNTISADGSDPAQEAQDLARGIYRNYIAAERPTGLPLYKLSLNTDTDTFFKNSVLAVHPSIEGPKNVSQMRLLAASQQIEKYLAARYAQEQSMKVQWLRELHAKLAHRLRFTLYQVNEAAEVGRIFESMNDRGKPLTELEKVKNYLLYVASTLEDAGDFAQSVNDTWATVLGRLAAADRLAPEDENQLLRVHWIAYYDHNRKSWDGSKTIRQRFNQRTYQGKQNELLSQLVNYTHSLGEACVAFCEAYSPGMAGAFSLFRGSPSLPAIVDWSRRLRRLGTMATFLPLVIAFRQRWPTDSDKYLELVKLCEAYAFRVYRLKGARADAGESTLYWIANQIVGGKVSYKDAIAMFKGDLAYRCNDPTFTTLLSPESESVRDAFNKLRGLKYLLYEYETHLATEKHGSPRLPWGQVANLPRKNTIEHVLPQTISDHYWEKRFGEHQGEKHNSFVHDLGNLALTMWNSHYSNKPFTDKKFQPPPNAKCYAEAWFFQENELVQWDEWTPNSISDRREKLLAWAKDRWSVDFSDTLDHVPEQETAGDRSDEGDEEDDVIDTESAIAKDVQ